MSNVSPITPATAPARKKFTLADATEPEADDRVHSVLIYGVEGVGKSSFAAGAPKPFFLRTEIIGDHIKAKRSPIVQSFDEAIDVLDALAAEDHDFSTLVVDTITQFQPLVWAKVLEGTKWKEIEEYGGGYMKGYEAALDKWRVFIKRCEDLRARRSMHLLFLGHCGIKSFKNPLGLDYDRYVPNVHAKAADLLKQRVDHVLFAKFEEYAATGDDKRRRGLSTGARLLHCQWSAAFDAKNRGDLPPQMPLSTFNDLITALRDGAPGSLRRLRAEFDELLPQLPADRQDGAREALKICGDDVGELAKLVDFARGEVMTSGQQPQEGSGS